MDYDIIIAGAGPAGTVAGINLIGCGARVLILDRGKFPRTKPCGGGISYRVFRRFPYLSDVFKSVPTNLVHRVVLISPHGEVVESSGPEPLYAMVRRYEFDAALLQKCRDGGIEIREQCTIARLKELDDRVAVVTTSGEEFTSRLLIGADGVNSVVAIESGLRVGAVCDAVARCRVLYSSLFGLSLFAPCAGRACAAIGASH